jgi:uncharacterized membrane protein
MMYGYGGMGVGWMLLIFLLLVVLCGGLAVVVVVAMTRGGHRVTTPPSVPASAAPVPSRAHAILDERFARGEIDEVEHRSRRAALDNRGA